MRVRLLSVGKPRDREIDSLHRRYAERIRKFGVDYEATWVEEVRPGGRFADDHVRARESEALLASLGDRGTSIALDRSGEAWTTEELAARLERWGSPAVTFLVGGPLGHHANLLSRAGHAWSLSRLTFPHELVRVLLAEQIYRALTILRGVPYHKRGPSA